MFRDRNSLHVVHGRNGSIGASIFCEADETEATAAASIAVLDDNLVVILVRCDCAVSWCQDSQLRRLGRTLRTWRARSGRQCARQGRCWLLSVILRRIS